VHLGLKKANQLLLVSEVSNEYTKGTTETTEASARFEFGDSNHGDEYVLDLFIDDKYGTIIFDTVAGRSKCPHEENAIALEIPNSKNSRYPSQFVFPPDEMVFDLDLDNIGDGDESSLVLNAHQLDNEAGLSITLDDAPFVGHRMKIM